MSRVACVWANLANDTDASTWYEDTHVSKAVEKLRGTAWNALQSEDDTFKEVAPIIGSHMTLYDLPDGLCAKDINAQLQPVGGKMPQDAKLDTRVYNEHATLYGTEWPGHTDDIQLIITVFWHATDAAHDGFLKWFETDFTPGMLASPELLRARVFKLQHASVYEDGQVKEQDVGEMFQYMTIWEIDGDELPWEALLYLGSSERWRYYIEGGHVQWQLGQFLVNRTYPNDEDESPAAQ